MLLVSAPQYASAALLLLLPLLLAALVAELAPQPAHATSNWESRFPPASRSSYASLGEIKSWSGSVDSYEGLTTLLESCSFRKEIIIISTTDVFVDAAAQTVWMLRRFAIDHIIVMTPSEEACAATRQRIPGICCAWNDIWFGLPPLKNKLSEQGFSGHRRLMQMRLRLAARALRLSYNVLFLDTDIIVFDDPYKYLKAPPFDEIEMMFSGGDADANIGIMYVQNVAPDGPVSWIFAETADRMLRWSEAPEFITEREWPVLRNYQHLMWDQSNFIDAYVSAQLGRPTFHAAWNFHGENAEFNRTWLDAHIQLTGTRRKILRGSLNDAAKGVARVDHYELHSVELHRVFTGGRWPVTFGGAGYPLERKEYSKAWQEQLRESGRPLWPEPEDPACADQPDLFKIPGEHSSRSSAVRNLAGGDCPGRMAPERVVFFPTWMVAFWSYMNQMQHDWDVKKVPPTQVFGHNLFLVGDKRVYKNVLKFTYGWYNWTLSQTSREKQVFFASTTQQPVPKVLVASPTLLDSFVKRPEPMKFLRSMRLLFYAAAAMGRAFALPMMTCEDVQHLMHAIPKEPKLKINTDPWFSSASVPFSATDKDDQCFWSAYMGNTCLEHGRGLLPPELEYLLSTLPTEQSTQNQANTLVLTPADRPTRRIHSLAVAGHTDGHPPYQERAHAAAMLQADATAERSEGLDAYEELMEFRGDTSKGNEVHGRLHLGRSTLHAGHAAQRSKRVLQRDSDWPGVDVVGVTLEGLRAGAEHMSSAPILFIDRIPHVMDASSDMELEHFVKPAMDHCYAYAMWA